MEKGCFFFGTFFFWCCRVFFWGPLGKSFSGKKLPNEELPGSEDKGEKVELP